MKTITAVFKSIAEAREVVAELRRLGIPDEEIIVAAGGDLATAV